MPYPAQAGRGIPGSPEFGYGARLELDGLYLEDALELAADIQFDWLAVTVRWAALQPDTPYAARLDTVMAFAARNRLSVLISLTQPPAAALSANGPDPAQTASLVQSLAQRYPGTLAAVELFPAANTHSGWGAEPNPQRYAQLYNHVLTQIQSAGLPLLLVGCGLQPLSTSPSSGEMDDLAFLAGVYKAGAFPPVISVLLNEVSVDLLAPPDSANHHVLRHYEAVRQVMVTYGQEKSILWITAFRASSVTIPLSESNFQDIARQKAWLYQACAQLRSQLYIGVVVYQSLNPADVASAQHALVTSTPQYHPFASIFRELVSQNGGSINLPRYGRPKYEGLEKLIH